MKRQQQQGQFKALLARLRSRVHWLRMSVVFTASALPDRIAREWKDVSAGMTPARIAAIAVLVVATVAPTTMLIIEHGRRVALESENLYLSVSSHAEIATLRNRMGDLMEEQSQLRHLLLDAGFAVHTGTEISIPLVATGYSSSVIETDATPFITASNTRTRKGIVALSRDLIDRYNDDAPVSFGKTVRISGLGDFIVEDSMNSRWRRRVDIWFPSRPAAFAFGTRKVILTVSVDDEGDYSYKLPANLAAAGGGGTIDSP